jgi:hypothetical protein
VVRVAVAAMHRLADPWHASPNHRGTEGVRKMGEQADALLERLLGSLIGAAEMMNVYLGDRLGLYGPLADGWRTSSELAAEAGIAERYAREWLEEQAVAGFIDVEDASASAADRRYMLSPEHAQVLLDRDAPTYLAAYPRMFVAAASVNRNCVALTNCTDVTTALSTLTIASAGNPVPLSVMGLPAATTPDPGTTFETDSVPFMVSVPDCSSTG